MKKTIILVVLISLGCIFLYFKPNNSPGVDTISSASQQVIICKEYRWDCSLEQEFARIERMRFFSTYIFPFIMLTYVVFIWFIPLLILYKLGKSS